MTTTVEPSVPSIARRPTATRGLWGWVVTTDHKKIGVMYLVTAFAFFLIAGLEALFIRVQLAGPIGTASWSLVPQTRCGAFDPEALSGKEITR